MQGKLLNGQFGVMEKLIHDKAVAFAQAGVLIYNRFVALHAAKAAAETQQILVGCVRREIVDVYVGGPARTWLRIWADAKW